MIATMPRWIEDWGSLVTLVLGVAAIIGFGYRLLIMGHDAKQTLDEVAGLVRHNLRNGSSAPLYKQVDRLDRRMFRLEVEHDIEGDIDEEED